MGFTTDSAMDSAMDYPSDGSHGGRARFDELSGTAKTIRIAHGAVTIVEIASVSYVWVCALGGRRDKWLKLALLALAGEGVGLAVGRGHCPLGPLQARQGDPTPLFELVLPKRAAKLAVPFLAAVTVGGLVTLVGRRT